MRDLLRTIRGSFSRTGGEAACSAPAPPIPKPRLIATGHSHLQAVIDAQTNRVAAGVSGEGDVQFIQMLDAAYEPLIAPEDGKFALHAALVQRLRHSLAAPGTRQALLSFISGNEYHFYGLVNHERPFDFVLPGAPDLPLQPGSEVVPTALVRQTIHHAMEFGLTVLTAFRAATDVPIWQAQSPPPVPSEAYIRAFPVQFRSAIERYGVAPAPLRYKLWRLQSDLTREACEALGIFYLPTPPEALDADGFLAQDCWNPDPTHANSNFGALVLRQFEALCERDYNPA